MAEQSKSEGGMSRREFMTLATAGVTALNNLCILDVHADDRDAKAGSSANPPRLSAATPGDPSITVKHESLNLNGVWSVTALPLDAAGEPGYRLLAGATGEAIAA